MYLKLIREKPNGNAVRGKLYEATYDVLTNTEELHLICPTLENSRYLIQPLSYPLAVSYSPKFKRALPLVGQVPGRTGIRFHPGSKPEHSRGCILVSRAAEQKLIALILGEKEVRMEVNEDEVRPM